MYDQEMNQEITRRVMVRAATDAEFRKELLESPKSALTRFLGPGSWSEKRYQFIENPNVDAVFHLPEFVGEGSLTTEELEAAAGGVCGTCSFTCLSTSHVRQN